VRRALALVLGAALLAGCGGAHTSKPPTAQIRTALIARLRAKQLDYRWVVCIPNGRSFRGQPIVRCNVDFGDPHVEAYCSVLVRGRLVTNFDDPALPCGHDDAGFTAPITSS
jgi:hypothetical protein